MAVKKFPKIFFIFSPLAFYPMFFGNSYSQISNLFFPKSIEVNTGSLSHDSDGRNAPEKWNILDKLLEKDDELAKAPVSIGPREIPYYENRISILNYDAKIKCEKAKGVWIEDGRICKSIVRKKLSDKERTFGLKLLNIETGEVNIIQVSTKITPAGVSLLASAGYEIELAERPNGISWNYWNTQYKVMSPANTVVIKNSFPEKRKITVSKIVNGKIKKEIKETVESFFYAPYSDYFESGDLKKDLVDLGVNYDKNIVAQAFTTLKERGVKSKAFPGKLISEVEDLPPRFFERLPFLEQGDLTEFKLNPQKTFERVSIILGANMKNAWAHTCNRSNACGWIQFTPGTYKNIQKTYPAAKLTVSFEEGSGDHLNSMMAAILLYDYNLSNLIKKYGKNISNDPRLDEYLAASYNGAPKWVNKSLDATLLKNVPDWTRYLKKETIGFMEKLRYLKNNNLP